MTDPLDELAEYLRVKHIDHTDAASGSRDHFHHKYHVARADEATRWLTALEHVRADARRLKESCTPQPPVRVWYMRDNHTFLELPLDEERAIAMLQNELARPDGMGRCGTLCSKQVEITLRHLYQQPDEHFLADARPLLRKAIDAALARKEVE